LSILRQLASACQDMKRHRVVTRPRRTITRRVISLLAALRPFALDGWQ
jgi:hypothetical protein